MSKYINNQVTNHNENYGNRDEGKKVEEIIISILCTSYNHELYIREALESVLAQKIHVPIEILIADDCSTDNTPKIIDEYAKRYPHLIKTLPKSKNIGRLKNLQNALQHCKGEFIAILECDDFWTNKYKLRKQYELLKSDEQALFSFSNIALAHQDTKEISAHIPHVKNKLEKKLTFDELLKYYNPIGNFSCCMYKKEAFEYVPISYFNGSGNADWLLHMYILDNSPYALYVSEILSVYRLHASSVYSSQSTKSKQDTFLLCLQNYAKIFEKNHNKIFTDTISNYNNRVK